MKTGEGRHGALWRHAHRFAPRDLADWPGRVLLIESRHDETFASVARAEASAVRDFLEEA